MRLDVVLEETLGGLERGRSEFHSGVVFHPDLQPCSHGVGLGSAVVDANVFLDGFFQLLLTIREVNLWTKNLSAIGSRSCG